MKNNKEQSVRRAILILGMHRSGTSAVGAALSVCGVDFGEHLMKATPGVNEKGFWEHIDIAEIHDQLLLELGSSWDDVRPLPAMWEKTSEAQRAMQSLRAVIDRDFSNIPLWGVKDPRLCRLLPLWHILLSEMDIDAGYVITLRHPVEVMLSLEKRDGFSQAKALHLYATHLLNAEYWTRGYKRTFIQYGDLIQNPEITIKEALIKLEIASDMDIGEPLSNLIEPGLQHHHVRVDENYRDGASNVSMPEEIFYHLRSLPNEYTPVERLNQIRESIYAPNENMVVILLEHTADVQERLRIQTTYALSLRDAKVETDSYNESLVKTLSEKESSWEAEAEALLKAKAEADRYNESMLKGKVEADRYNESLVKMLSEKESSWEAEAEALLEAKAEADRYNESMLKGKVEADRYNESLVKMLSEKESSWEAEAEALLESKAEADRYNESLVKMLLEKESSWEAEAEAFLESKAEADRYNESLVKALSEKESEFQSESASLRHALDISRQYSESLRQELDLKNTELAIALERQIALDSELASLKKQALVRLSSFFHSPGDSAN
jgi:hypothetical protein